MTWAGGGLESDVSLYNGETILRYSKTEFLRYSKTEF